MSSYLAEKSIISKLDKWNGSIRTVLINNNIMNLKEFGCFFRNLINFDTFGLPDLVCVCTCSTVVRSTKSGFPTDSMIKC